MEHIDIKTANRKRPYLIPSISTFYQKDFYPLLAGSGKTSNSGLLENLEESSEDEGSFVRGEQLSKKHHYNIWRQWSNEEANSEQKDGNF